MPDFIIGLDLDGVCYHFVRTANYMLRSRLAEEGRPIPEALTRMWNHWDEAEKAVSRDDWRWLWTDGVTQGLFRYGHVIGGSIEGVQALNNLGDVVAITARPKTAVHDTLVWLSTMFDKAPLSGLVIQSHGQKKSEVVPEPNVFIDDATHNADDLLDNTGSSVVLFDAPYNQGYTGGPSLLRKIRLFRAKGWPEVVRTVKAIKEAGL